MSTPSPTERLPLHLNPDCPRFATAPVKDDGRLDADKFSTLLGLGERPTSLEDYLTVMRGTPMEDVPLVRQRTSLLTGIKEPQTWECHPLTWEAMPEEFRESFELVG